MRRKSITICHRLKLNKLRRGVHSVVGVLRILCNLMRTRLKKLTSRKRPIQLTARRLTLIMKRRNYTPISKHKFSRKKVRVPVAIGIEEKGIVNLWHEPSKLDMIYKVNKAFLDGHDGKGLENVSKSYKVAALKADQFKKITILPSEEQVERNKIRKFAKRLESDPNLDYDPYLPIDEQSNREETTGRPDSLRALDEIHKNYYGKQIVESKNYVQTKIDDYFRSSRLTDDDDEAIRD